MDLTDVGHKLAWPSLAWIALAYPVGKVIDSRGALSVLGGGLAIITVGYVLSFFLVVELESFFVSSMVTGVAFGIVMVAQLQPITRLLANRWKILGPLPRGFSEAVFVSRRDVRHFRHEAPDIDLSTTRCPFAQIPFGVERRQFFRHGAGDKLVDRNALVTSELLRVLVN
jgi:hypothetical protein